MAFDDRDTVDGDPVAAAADPVEVDLIEATDVEIAAATHRGNVRKNNEDQFAVVRRTRSGEVVATSLAKDKLRPGDEQHSWLLAVADGVGGNVSGEIASATAIQSIVNLGPHLSSWVMQPSRELQEDHESRVELYAQAIQRELQHEAEADPGLKGMATTITAVYFYGSDAIVVNVGDSRCYLARENMIHQVTRDHTLARDLAEAGLPPKAIRRYQHVLTRCFNTRSESVTFDIFRLHLHPHDQLLLCSDGLSDMVTDDELNRILARDASVNDVCEQLVTEALINGGRDNITVVLARIH
jgi:serine/threonine protein phosphatase PrpC